MDAARMGERLARKKRTFDTFYSSPAFRALQTAEIIARHVGFPADDVIARRAFYTFDADGLLRAVESIDERFSVVAVFCHNCAVTDLANRLTGAAIENVPTCGVVHVETDATSWADVLHAPATLADYDFPKKSPA